MEHEIWNLFISKYVLTSNFSWSILIYISETITSQETKEKITEEPTPIISEKIEKIEPKHEIKKQENVTSSDDPSKITLCTKSRGSVRGVTACPMGFK